MTYCSHGINHAGERHGCDGCCCPGADIPSDYTQAPTPRTDIHVSDAAEVWHKANAASTAERDVAIRERDRLDRKLESIMQDNERLRAREQQSLQDWKSLRADHAAAQARAEAAERAYRAAHDDVYKRDRRIAELEEALRNVRVNLFPAFMVNEDEWVSRHNSIIDAALAAPARPATELRCQRCKDTGWYKVPGGIEARCLCSRVNLDSQKDGGK